MSYVDTNEPAVISENDLNRFKRAQHGVTDRACDELRSGCKMSHWIWFVFPQLRGLGMSETAWYYGIDGIDEAVAYLKDKELRSNLLNACMALVSNIHDDDTQVDPLPIFGYIDTMKLKSSMTLFEVALAKTRVDGNDIDGIDTRYRQHEGGIFGYILDRFFDGERDELTLGMLGDQTSDKTMSQR